MAWTASPQFIAFNAHAWFAAFVCYVCAVCGAPMLPVYMLAVGLAAAKEFGFDAAKETTPPQTFWDNLDDFAGYVIGMVIAAIAFHFTPT